MICKEDGFAGSDIFISGFFVTCSLNTFNCRKLKLSLILLITTIFFAVSTTAQESIYIWSKIDPGWKNRSLDHWSNIKGYGKSVPLEMSTLISEYYAMAEKQLVLSLKENLINSDLPKTTIFTKNPGANILRKTDLFLDLQCNIVEISKEYPNFRNRKIRIEPIINYTLTLYDSRVDVIYKKVFSDSIDYKRKIRPLLKGMSEHRRDIEIVRYSFIESFSGEMVEQIISELAVTINTQENKKVNSDPDKFRQVLGLVFEKRKLQHPLDYSDVQFKKNSSPTITSRDESKTAEAANTNSELSKKITSLIEDSRYYALLIGINDYSDPEINDLDEPLSDAQRLYNILVKTYTFNEENILLLSNPTRDQLIQSFDNLAYNLTENDNLLIFYAGHGLWDEQLKKGFWIPSDASTGNRANWFSNSDLRDYIGGIKAKHTLLISDACFSGGIFKTREVFSGVTPATLELYKLPSRKAMTSGTMTTVPDKSVFIEFLIKRLNENTNPFLSSEQLFASFKLAVINNSSTNQVPQFGEIRETGDEGGDFLFIRRNN